MIDLNATSAVGVLLMAVFVLAGFYFGRDNTKLKALSFGVGVATAATLMGLDLNATYADLVQTFGAQINVPAVVTSMVSAGIAASAPIKPLRNAGLSLSGISLVGGLFGAPSYISIGITIGILVLILYMLFRLSSKGLTALKDMSKQSKLNADGKSIQPTETKSIIDKLIDFGKFVVERYESRDPRKEKIRN